MHNVAAEPGFPDMSGAKSNRPDSSAGLSTDSRTSVLETIGSTQSFDSNGKDFFTGLRAAGDAQIPNIRHLVRSFWAKLAVSAAVLALALVIGWLLPLTPPATFDAAARIWVQSKMPGDSSDSHQSSNLFQSFMTYFNSPILTACEVLKSSVVYEEAIKELKENKDPKTRLPADEIPTLSTLKMLVKVEPVHDTDILAIYYQDTNPVAATTVIQAIIDAFIRLQTDQTTYSAKQSQSFLLSQLNDARQQLNEIDERIRSFQVNNNLVDPQGQVEGILKIQTTTEEGIKEAEARGQEDQIRVNFLQSHLGISAEQALNQQESGTDALSARAGEELAQLELKYAELGTNYRPEHPQMRRLKSLIDKLKSAGVKDDSGSAEVPSLPGGPAPTFLGNVAPTFLGNAASAITGNAANGLSNGNVRRIPSLSVRQEMIKELIATKADQMSQQRRAAQMKEHLEALDARISKLPAKQLEIADLLRAQKVLFEQISGYEANLNAAKLIEAVNKHNSNYQVIDRPEIINVTVASKRPKFLVAFLLGLVLAGGTFFLLDRMDPRIRKIASILEILPLPVVGWFEHFPTDLSAEAMEPMHRLRAGLRNWLREGRSQFVVSSADPGDGKSLLSTGLAISFAESGLRVLLVDMNLTTPAATHIFKNLQSQPGLSEYLLSPSPELWSKVTQTVSKNLKVITAGGLRAEANNLLSSERIMHFMQRAQNEADVVIYDTAPLSKTSAALTLLSDSVNLLVVVRRNHTHNPALRLLAAQLKQYEVGAAGIVLANVDDEDAASALSKGERVTESEPAGSPWA